MKLIVDRIENGIAVLEKDDLSVVEVALSALPDGTKEGSVILQNEDGSYNLDLTEEEARRKRLLELQKNLFKK